MQQQNCFESVSYCCRIWYLIPIGCLLYLGHMYVTVLIPFHMVTDNCAPVFGAQHKQCSSALLCCFFGDKMSIWFWNQQRSWRKQFDSKRSCAPRLGFNDLWRNCNNCFRAVKRIVPRVVFLTGQQNAVFHCLLVFGERLGNKREWYKIKWNK